MANVYAVRVHEQGPETRAKLVAFCTSIGGSYVMARETDAARAHFQGWVRTEMKPQTFRVRVKKAFPECVGNKGYSVSSVKNFEAYSRYILKGTKEAHAEVVCFQGIEITTEYIASEHRAYWSSAERPAKSNRSVVEVVYEWAVAHEGGIDRASIAKFACDLIVARKKPLNVFYVRGVVNSVEYWLGSRGRDIILDEIVNKY